MRPAPALTVRRVPAADHAPFGQVARLGAHAGHGSKAAREHSRQIRPQHLVRVRVRVRVRGFGFEFGFGFGFGGAYVAASELHVLRRRAEQYPRVEGPICGRQKAGLGAQTSHGLASCVASRRNRASLSTSARYHTPDSDQLQSPSVASRLWPSKRACCLQHIAKCGSSHALVHVRLPTWVVREPGDFMRSCWYTCRPNAPCHRMNRSAARPGSVSVRPDST